jgi:hypothetical protein
MVGQHDAAGADADMTGFPRNMADHDGRSGAGDPRHVVMLGQPESAITPSLRTLGQIDRVAQRFCWGGIIPQRDEIKDGVTCSP